MLTLRAANFCAVLPIILGTIVSVAHADDQLAAMAAAADQARTTVTAWHGPTNSPPLQKGKTIYAITCASQGIGCVRAANGAKEGGETAGWTVRVIDGKGDPGTWNGAIQSAIAAKADGIVLAAVPPALVGDAIERAKKSNVSVVSVFNPIPEANSSVFAWVRPEHPAQGALMADWVAQDSQGKAHVLVVEDREFGELRQRVTAFGEEIKKCSGCKAVGSVDITLGTMVQRLPGLISAQLSANPDIDYIVVPYDSAAFFVGEGVRQAGRTGKVKIAGYEGDPQTIDAIHNGTQAATIADPAEWMGWQAIDELNRSFAGGPAQNTPVVFKLIDKNNAPDTKGWLGDYDFKAEYRKLWGVK
jgi:ribose transport system substrate-binding protein